MAVASAPVWPKAPLSPSEEDRSEGWDHDDCSGNTCTRGTLTLADYSYTDVVITVEGLQLTPIVQQSTCSGQRTTFDVRSTDPAARVFADATMTSEPCGIVGMDDAELMVSGQRGEPYLEIVVGAGPPPCPWWR